MLSLAGLQLVLTFNCDKDSLLDEELWLDEHTADVGTLVHSLLNITQLQGSILKHHLHEDSILTTLSIHAAKWCDQTAVKGTNFQNGCSCTLKHFKCFQQRGLS